MRPASDVRFAEPPLASALQSIIVELVAAAFAQTVPRIGCPCRTGRWTGLLASVMPATGRPAVSREATRNPLTPRSPLPRD